MSYKNSIHYISVDNGEDICEKLLSFANGKKQEIYVISVTGLLAKVTFKRDESYEHKGPFTILSLSGRIYPIETYPIETNTESFSMIGHHGGLIAVLINKNGCLQNGFVSKGLIAQGQVEVIISTFTYVPKEDKIFVEAKAIDLIPNEEEPPQKMTNIEGDAPIPNAEEPAEKMTNIEGDALIPNAEKPGEKMTIIEGDDSIPNVEEPAEKMTNLEGDDPIHNAEELAEKMTDVHMSD